MNEKLKLTDREWSEFYFSDVFTHIQRGKRLKKDDHIEGTIPYVSSTATNNGIDGFIGNKEKVRVFSNCISLANSGSVGSAFFQKFEFVASDHVTSLQKEGINEYVYLFMLPIISRLSEKYSFNREINDLRISRERLMLPIKVDGTPDWAFMEAYMKQVEEEHLSEVLPILEARLLEHIITLGALEDREWKEFHFRDVFYIVDGYYNKKPSMDENGRLPFLGATQYNNGVTGMTSKDNVRLRDKVGGDSMNDVEKRFYAGGCIAITNNGSVGHAYYQSTEFTCSHDITVVYLKDQVMSKELATFLIPSIQKAGESFAYAKKWRPIRMRRSKLMLPVKPDGTPDWDFMSDFMKKVEQDTLSEALRYFKPMKYKRMLTGGGKIRSFFMEDILRISNGVRLTKADMTIGNRPFVGSSEACNGVTGFVDNNNASLDKEVLGVNYNGSVGFSFYHPYEALFSDDVKRVRWKDEAANNKYTLLYLSNAIAQQRSKYAYGYKFNALRMKRQIIMLPTLADGTPDFLYMEHTMRVMEYDILFTYLKQMNGN